MGKILVAAVFFAVLISSCDTNNIEEDQKVGNYLKENKLTGCFGFFDNGNGRFTIYNVARFRDSAFLPASTFKIVNSLVGLETGRARDSAFVIPWDGIKRFRTEWNQDLTMEKAFEYSSVPWYQELARRIGKDTMQHWLDTLGYASRYKKPLIANNPDTFWLDNSVRITADEQLGLVKKLYFGQLPFQSRTQRVVRNLMLRENNANYKLSYKTGWGRSDKNHLIGWIVGWIEENRHPYFFALELDSADPTYDKTDVGLKILKQILKDHGFFQGKK
jgi:beta-lactamase class D